MAKLGHSTQSVTQHRDSFIIVAMYTVPDENGDERRTAVTRTLATIIHAERTRLLVRAEDANIGDNRKLGNRSLSEQRALERKTIEIILPSGLVDSAPRWRVSRTTRPNLFQARVYGRQGVCTPLLAQIYIFCSQRHLSYARKLQLSEKL